MIKAIKKFFGITTPITKDNRPEQWVGKYAGNSHQRRVAKRKAERKQCTSVDEANKIIQFLHNEINEAKEEQDRVDQRDFSDYPTLIDRRN